MATRIWDGATTSVFATAGNWSDDTAPVAGDTAIMPDGNTVAAAGAALYDQALAVFTVSPGYSGTIGSRTAGVISDLMLKPVIANLAGSGVAYLNLASCTTCNVTGAAAGTPTTGTYGLALSGATFTTLNIDLGASQSVGVAALAGQTCTATTINIDGRGTVVLGAGLTCTTLNIRGSGTVYVKPSIATINVIDGSPSVYIQEASAVTALTVQAGTTYEHSTGTKTTVVIFEPANIVCGPGSRTWTNTTIYGEGGLDDDVKSVTWTNPYKDYGKGTNIKLGSNKAVQRTAIA